MMKGLKNVMVTDQRAQMTFCASCKSCPAIDISKDSDKVVVGGDDEGYTEFTKDQFALFVKTVKEGMYDKYLPKDCVCGQHLMKMVLVMDLTLMCVKNHQI
jgi:hypothetical protein